jgi:hypothetical protein
MTASYHNQQLSKDSLVSHSPSFETDGAAVQDAVLLPPGQSVTPLAWEKPKANLSWENWDASFSALDMPGMIYNGCRMAVGSYTYAARGDRNNPQLARSHAIVSQWGISDPSIAPINHAAGITTVKAFFPVYDGIGFWIGKRRREQQVRHYTPGEEIAIAQASAIGALGLGKPFGQPHNGELIYRCIWAPGKAFTTEGELIHNSTNNAMGALGLEIHEVIRPGTRNDSDHRVFRLYGDAHILANNTTLPVIRVPFTADLATALLPAWKRVTKMLADPDPPPEETY